MERRSHRLLVLAVVVVLHLPLLLLVRDAMLPSLKIAIAPQQTVIEFLLRPELVPMPQAPDSALRVTRSNATVASRTRTMNARFVGQTAASRPRTDSENAVVPVPRGVVGDDGRVRVSGKMTEYLDRLAAEQAAQAAAERGSFHMPRGNSDLMRDRAPILDPQLTRFSKDWKPAGMNPLEEACWKNKALAFAMALLQSADCIAPGQKPPAPPPELIVYGRDDVGDVLRKTEDWAKFRK